MGLLSEKILDALNVLQAVTDAQEIAGNLVLKIARRGVLVTVGEVAAVPVADLQF
jgi:hypothetical protein